MAHALAVHPVEDPHRGKATGSAPSVTIAASGRADLAQPPLMRIFVWHGYLLGGTGSNIYARQLSREWSREGHDVTVFSQEPHPERFDLGGAATAKPDVGGLLPVFVLDRYEGYEVKRVQDCSRDELDDVGRGERARPPRARPGRSHLRQPRPAGRARRGGQRRPLHRQGARLRARVLDARQRRAVGLGRRGARRRGGDHRRLGAHPRGRARGLRHRRRRPRGAARAWTSSCGGRRPAGRGARAADRGGAARSAEPRQRERAAAGRGQPGAARRVPRGRAPDRRLLRQADREQGRAGAARGAARARRARR